MSARLVGQSALHGESCAACGRAPFRGCCPSWCSASLGYIASDRQVRWDSGLCAVHRATVVARQTYQQSVLRQAYADGRRAEAKDVYTKGHSLRCRSTRTNRGVPRGTSGHRGANRVRGAASRLGEGGVSRRVLGKPGGLSETEYDEIKRHPRDWRAHPARMSHSGQTRFCLHCRAPARDSMDLATDFRLSERTSPSRLAAFSRLLRRLRRHDLRTSLSWSDVARGCHGATFQGQGTQFDEDVVVAFGAVQRATAT